MLLNLPPRMFTAVLLARARVWGPRGSQFKDALLTTRLTGRRHLWTVAVRLFLKNLSLDRLVNGDGFLFRPWSLLEGEGSGPKVAAVCDYKPSDKDHRMTTCIPPRLQ